MKPEEMTDRMEKEVFKQPETLGDEKQDTLGKGEDSLISTRPMGGDKVGDRICLSVLTREQLISSHKQSTKTLLFYAPIVFFRNLLI